MAMPVDGAATHGAHEFGSGLKATREARGLSIEDLSRTTRISAISLTRIETCDWGELPAEVFVTGFVRAYARAVGLDERDVVRRYRQIRDGRSLLPVELAKGYGAGALPPRVRRIWVALALMLVVAIVLVTFPLLLHRGGAPTKAPKGWLSK